LFFLSILLLGSIAVADIQSFYLEQEELLETSEFELEELKEGKEGKEVTILLASGGLDLAHAQNCFYILTSLVCSEREIKRQHLTFTSSFPDLYVQYCSLRVHPA
jgi:hypothetical protein